MRLFIALSLSKELEDYFTKIQDEIQIITDNVRLVEPKNVHLTLKFLGEVPDQDVNGIVSTLKKIIHPKIMLETSDIGFFPNNSNPKVLWVGISNEETVISLYKDVNSRLGKDFVDEFEFSAHITLGRVAMPLKRVEIEKMGQIKIERKKCVVNEFNLMKSVLTPKGPVYSVVESFSLK